MNPQKVLIIDDDLDVCALVSGTADDMGIVCICAADADAFFQALDTDVTLILLDLLMPGTDGIEVLRKLGEQRCQAGIVVMSGVGPRVIETAEALAASLGLSIVGHLSKPFRIADLEQVLTRRAVPTGARHTKDKGPIVFEVAELWRALDQGEFVLHYQPQIEIATGRCLGMEALVRWQHPRLGLIYPDDFIEFAEDLNLIDRLTWLVIERGFAEMGHTVDSTGRQLMLSLNLSVFSLRELTFPDTFLSIAKANDVNPEHIILEITESGLIRELSRTLDVLTRLRMKGVRLSIDDFGIGYSMMQQLRHIPANEIKIDKSLIQNMRTANDRVMIEKVIELGRDLNMTVVAEGVETSDQLDFLRGKKCDIAQGYYFSKPLPGPDFLDWLGAHQELR